MRKSEVRLTNALARTLPAPERDNRVTYDGGEDSIRGFGLRVTSTGTKSFVLNYTVGGRERRYTIGSYPAWSVALAREEAKRLRQLIDRDIDPLGEREAERAAPTVNELCDRYIAEHAVKKRTGDDDESMIRRLVRPVWGNRKVAEIGFADVDRLHRRATKDCGPYQANRLHSLLGKIFSLSVRWGMRADNPAKGVERNHEERRYRYLVGEELRRLTMALATHPSQTAANAVRLLLLTGARRGEVLSATWGQFDLSGDGGIWTKPSSHTKQKREHVIPLSAPARQLLVEMRVEAERRARERGREPSRYVFPARVGDGPMTEIKKAWAALCEKADLRGVRIHDLRHSHASILASAGFSLPVIAALLGHTQASTTNRYSHLFIDVLRAATERASAVISGTPAVCEQAGEAVPLQRHSR